MGYRFLIDIEWGDEMKKIVGFSILCFFFILPATVFAQEKVYEVDASVLLVREEPASNSDVIGKLQAGDKIKVFQEKHGWYQTYVNGQSGWVASQYLFASDSETAVETTSSKEITVQAEGTRIRSGPDTSNSIINFATNGDKFSVVETQSDWIKVQLNDGSTGWVARWLTSDSANDSQSSSSNETTQSESAEVEQVARTENNGDGDLSGYNIVLDPGHGGHDPGAIGLYGNQEKDLAMIAANQIASDLESAGANVILTRSNDTFISLEERVNISHSYHTDAFISLHYNANPLRLVNGISTYYTNDSDQSFAYQMQQSLAEHVDLTDRGVMHESLHVLRNNDNPALLLELGFITNPHDIEVIQTESYQSNIGQAVTNALSNYFH